MQRILLLAPHRYDMFLRMSTLAFLGDYGLQILPNAFSNSPAES
jgi:hypothetical protein